MRYKRLNPVRLRRILLIFQLPILVVSMYLQGMYPMGVTAKNTREAIIKKFPYYDPDSGCGSLDETPPKPNPESTPATTGPLLPTGPDPGVKDPFKGPKITPTGVILHWTAYEYKNPQDLVNILRGRVATGFPNGRAVQLTIDKQGKVHQLSESLETKPIQTFVDPSWNNASIGIEIQSITTDSVAAAEQDLLSNAVQYQAVLGTIRELMAKYSIPAASDIGARKGVFGHYETTTTNLDPGKKYMEKLRAELSQDPNAPPPNIDQQPADTETQSGAGSNGCKCTTGVGLNGSDNPSKVWNYLTGKGLTAIQAAGAMGNLQTEGNFNPKIVEKGNWGGRSWGGESDTVPPPVGKDGQPGYGIVQWTSPGRKQGLIDLAAAKNLPVYDLGLQLDWMWTELESPYYKSRALDPLKSATTLASAVSIWQDKYEVGQDFAPRMAFAEAWLAKLGSGTGTPPTTGPVADTTGSTGGAGCDNSGSSGVVNAEGYSFPVSPASQAAHKRVTAMSSLPCGNTGGCHHKGPAGCCSPAFDISVHTNPVGTPIFAISDGQIVSANDNYDGNAGCFTIQLKSSKDNFIYAFLHVSQLTVKTGDQVKSGQQIAQIGRTQCARNTYPHLHLDRGCIQGGVPQRGGGTDCRDPGIIPLINALFNGLPA